MIVVTWFCRKLVSIVPSIVANGTFTRVIACGSIDYFSAARSSVTDERVCKQCYPGNTGEIGYAAAKCSLRLVILPGVTPHDFPLTVVDLRYRKTTSLG